MKPANTSPGATCVPRDATPTQSLVGDHKGLEARLLTHPPRGASLRDIVDIDVDVTAIPEAELRALVESLATFMESIDLRTMDVARRLARLHTAAHRELLALVHAQPERNRDLDRCVAFTLVQRAVTRRPHGQTE